MTFDYDFTYETKLLIEIAHLPGVAYQLHFAASEYAKEKEIYQSDIRYSMKRCEVVAVEKYIVPGLMRYWAIGRDIDWRSLTMIVIIGDYPLVEIEKLMISS